MAVRVCRLVFGAGRKAGILPAGPPPRVDFVGFGLVLGADGKRIRTRDEGAVRWAHAELLAELHAGVARPELLMHFR